ncbi:MAG: hypothetical protein IJ233_00495, partial [Pyramidobacter sp.]|nr:hypothetical protein [Pyramidobacter sp.]
MRFYVSPQRAVKLVERFTSFEADRANVHKRMETFRPRPNVPPETHRLEREQLRRLLAGCSPDLRHSIGMRPGVPRRLPDPAFCWELADIAAVLDRSASTLSRTLNELSCRRLWRARLHEVRRVFRTSRAARYADGVFDLIVDFYELSYLERFTSPRSGSAVSDAEKREILAYWRFMHEHAFLSEEQLLDAAVPGP